VYYICVIRQHKAWEESFRNPIRTDTTCPAGLERLIQMNGAKKSCSGYIEHGLEGRKIRNKKESDRRHVSTGEKY